MPEESARPAQTGPPVELCLLGPFVVRRHGVAATLPASRKTRALLAYLALAPHPVGRSQLCELLWDGPNDPRGELRWCLSKIRSLVDEPGRHRLMASADAIRLDLADGFVDAVEIARAAQQGIAAIAPERLRGLAALFAGEFLDGLEVERSPAFTSWLAAQRRRFRGCRTALLERLAADTAGDERLGHLDAWLELAPFDPRVHALLLEELAGRGRIHEGEAHLAAAIRQFEADGLDTAPLREAWRTARAHHAELSRAAAAATAPTAPAGDIAGTRRPSVAVMPFTDRLQVATLPGGIADALAHDVTVRLAKLRSLFVIAQGTMSALRDRQVGAEDAGRMLNVDYVVSGFVEQQGPRLTVAAELAETRTARIVWAEMFNHRLDDAFLVLEEIGNRIVAAIDSEIETIERNRAILRPPNSLDAWEAHHRGLWHMYRFTRVDNDQARHFFQAALRQDPTFARAHAGLSFTHFQSAFQGWAPRGPEVDRAFEAAGRSLMADDRDPTAHWAIGRALWLRGEHDQAIVELEQAIELSPNFAQGHYTLAFVHSQTGDPGTAIASSERSRRLSPFDPMLFGFLGARAMALVRLGRFDEAAYWGVKAATRPNAHAQILAIAALSLALAGRPDEARGHVTAIRRALPHYRVDDFLTAMQFAPEDQRLFREAAKRIGLD
ncbi:tetratricopeptide repeat protein [Inquilinus limosus]|uniref:tetratricopeptide repeat protein n=1 Tax=Inquilinus limosus TaxID=171674 RepID=UPI003F183C00